MDDFELFEIIEIADKLLSVMNEVGDDIAKNTTPREIHEIVLFHSKGAAGAALASGWIPGLGGAALAATSAGFIWSMYLRINEKLGLKLSENMLKTLASGIATNLVGYIAAAIATTAILALIPIGGSVAAAVIAGGVAYALTIVSGGVYLTILTKIFQAKIDPNKVSTDDLKDMAEDVIKNSDVESALKKAKDLYKS